MKKALIAQLDTLPVGNDLHFRTAVSEEFAQALIETTGGQMARVFHVNSGSYEDHDYGSFRDGRY
jgi:adenosylmethionine-8-amino-7-oxononanoate aminotransferase